MQQSSENLSSTEFSEASNFDKIPSCVELSAPCHNRTEPYYSTCNPQSTFYHSEQIRKRKLSMHYTDRWY